LDKPNLRWGFEHGDLWSADIQTDTIIQPYIYICTYTHIPTYRQHADAYRDTYRKPYTNRPTQTAKYRDRDTDRDKHTSRETHTYRHIQTEENTHIETNTYTIKHTDK